MNSTDNRSAMPLQLLENYRNDTQTIESLRYALNHASRISPEETISAMNFSHSDGIGAVTGHISDKTAYIALHYQQETATANEASSGKLAAQLWDMEQARERLHFYVSLLEPRQAEVIRLHYFEGKTRGEICADLGIATRTYDKRRKGGVERLCEMYAMTSELGRGYANKA